MEKYSGIIQSKYLASVSKGHTANVALLTVLVEPSLDWDEFKTLPEELHLTNLEFEVFQIKDTIDFAKDYLKQIQAHHPKYDHKTLMVFGFDDSVCIPFLSNYDSIIILNADENATIEHPDLWYPKGFDNHLDIGIVEEMRFWINDRI